MYKLNINSSLFLSKSFKVTYFLCIIYHILFNDQTRGLQITEKFLSHEHNL